jgi:hypothetical protein
MSSYDGEASDTGAAAASVAGMHHGDFRSPTSAARVRRSVVPLQHVDWIGLGGFILTFIGIPLALIGAHFHSTVRNDPAGT